ncbi:MAG: hypothetical protein U0452_15075 [Anaerolineae bacterium]
MTSFDLFGLFSAIGVGVALILLGLLSNRLGAASKARPHTWGFYIAAGFLLGSAVLQAVHILLGGHAPNTALDSVAGLVAYNVMPAIGITIGLFYTWHYWSWLLAETG